MLQRETTAWGDVDSILLQGQQAASTSAIKQNDGFLKLLPPLFLSVLFTLIGRFILRKKLAWRNAIVKNVFWKFQFNLHPVIVGLCVYLASCPKDLYFAEYASFMVVPFAFNFAVEPWDLPFRDKLFSLFFYLHHFGPVVGCIAADWASNHLAAAGKIIPLSATVTSNSTSLPATALLFAHIWLLHPIGTLDAKKLLNKQKIFWPYVLQGFLLKIAFWREMITAEKVYVSNYGLIQMQTDAIVLAIFLQFIGRWGSFLRLRLRFKIMKEDKFEWHKCFWEPTLFFVAYVVANHVFLVIY
ncbi:unnamed protein product [Amoebophrya sp. A120]|nr:unnamed protein product [Amoebophrya sp. A120]|eukprot:GSA120T00007542001.1